MKLTENVFKNVLTNLCDGVRLIDKDRNVVYWNKGAEVITGFKSEKMIGRKCYESLHIMYGDERLNLCKDSCRTGEGKCTTPGEENAFIRHVDGYMVPVIMCVFPVCDDDGNVVGMAEMFHDISWKIAALNRIEELNRMTVIDPLTGVSNRRFAEATLNSKLEELKRFKMSFGVSYIDLDDFKTVNDSYGHNTGDSLLKVISRSIMASLRSYDTVSRMGGDEFLVIIGNVQSTDILASLSNRFLDMVTGSTLHVDDEEIKTTVSIGSTLAKPEDTVESLIKRADSMMYLSKAEGKNRITVQ